MRFERALKRVKTIFEGDSKDAAEPPLLLSATRRMTLPGED
jgi:hypothetical protein